MTAIVTDLFRIKNAKDFVASVGSNSLYLAIGGISSWPNDLAPPVPTSAYKEDAYDFWDDAFAAKRITSSDISHVIPRNDWVSGDAFYVAYDPTDALLNTKKFHTTINDNGIIKIYKLIVKGPGATTIMPTHTSANIPAVGADGYAWKYMYTVPADAYLKLGTISYIPIANISGNVASNSLGATPAPVGGHGFDNIAELGAYAVAINSRFAYDEAGLISVKNDFREVGIVQNPLQFNGVAGVAVTGNPVSGVPATAATLNLATVINLSSTSGEFQSDEVITTATGTARVVGHDIVGSKLHVLLLTGSISNGQTISAPSTAAATVGSIVAPGATKYSGSTIYLEYRRPVSRAGDQIESITTVIEF